MTEKEIGFSLAHVGINCADEEEARQTAQTLCALFGLEYRPGVKSVFAGSAVECMKSPAGAATATSLSPPATWRGLPPCFAAGAWPWTRPPAPPRLSTSGTRWEGSPSTWCRNRSPDRGP